MLNDFANMRSKDILAKLNMFQAPFNPFEIAELMGVKVIKTIDWSRIKYIKDGHIFLKDGLPVIWINPLRPENRQKFTLAHELGHLVYDVLPNLDKGQERFQQYYRNNNGGRRETRANQFAANLLMPVFAIKQTVDEIHSKDKNTTTDEYIDGLTSVFEVSKQAMIVRLKSLGVISQDYIYKYI